MMFSASSYRQLRFEGRPRRHREGPETPPPQPTLRNGRRTDELALSEPERVLAARVLSEAGLALAAYRGSPLRRRLPAVLRALRTADFQVAATKIEHNPELARRALNTLLIGHTTPFRDIEVFAALRNGILPALLQRKTSPRIWSVGCSGGEELLSVALLLAEAQRLHDCRLRGSDCRTAAIEEARRKGPGFAAALPLPWSELRRFCEQRAFLEAVQRIEWRVEDALSIPEEGSWDLILCRNVSIYLEPIVCQTLWERMRSCLAPGGILVTGKAERPCVRGFRRIFKCIYRRDEER